MQSIRRIGFTVAVATILSTGCNSPHDLPTEPLTSKVANAENAQEFREYLVRLNEATHDPAAVTDQIMDGSGGVVEHRFGTVFGGKAFVAWLEPEFAASIRDHPRVESVRTATDSIRPNLVIDTVDIRSQWGLDRIDQREGVGSMDDLYHYNNDGSGVHIYFIDTGVDSTHTEFAGRWGEGRGYGYMTPQGYTQLPPGIDDGGHGTFVASLAAGANVGVARDATIHSVRVTDGTATVYTKLVVGLDWVATNAESPAIVSFPWTSDESEVRQAIDDVYAAGVLVVTGAGNGNDWANMWESNLAGGGLIVGATDSLDTRWYEASDTASNWGSVLDVWAPGHYLHGASTTGAYTTGSGTSGATGIVAGVGALVLEQAALSPSDLRSALLGDATTGELSSIGSGSPNRLIYSLAEPPPLNAWITGPNEVPEWGTCTWQAQVDGGVPPYYYQWSGALYGSNSSVSGEGIEGWLYLTVTDSGSGQDSSSFQISIDEFAEECFE